MAYEVYLQILSLVGFVVSLYFFLAYRGLAKPSNKLIPSNICSEGKCHNVMKTRFAKVFKLHNWDLGLIYYALVFASTFFELGISLYFFLALSWFVFVFSAYLFYALIFVLRINCNLCFLSHLINLLIAVFYLLNI